MSYKKIELEYDPKDLFLDGYSYSVWLEKEWRWTDKEESEDLAPMPSLERYEEEVKEGQG